MTPALAWTLIMVLGPLIVFGPTYLIRYHGWWLPTGEYRIKHDIYLNNSNDICNCFFIQEKVKGAIHYYWRNRRAQDSFSDWAVKFSTKKEAEKYIADLEKNNPKCGTKYYYPKLRIKKMFKDPERQKLYANSVRSFNKIRTTLSEMGAK